jgi:hypothetical protein
MTTKTERQDYTIEELSKLIGVTPGAIRNALSRYRGFGFTEDDFMSGKTSVPLPYRTGRQLLWPADTFEAWKKARTRFILKPVHEQRASIAKARERSTAANLEAGVPQ